jgi:peptide/nickel transport system substrate-binding protein
MKTKILALAFAALMALSFSATVLGATPEEMAGIYGGDLKIAVKDTALDLNPGVAADDSSWGIINILYDSLGRRDPVTLEITPWVADSWTVNDIAGEVTVMLNPAAEWHDGSPVTASDVEYTYETFYTGYSVSVVSSTEVVFSFTSGGGRFMTEGLLMPLVKSGDASPTEGCGPFELVEKVAGDHVTVGAYAGYFEGRPYVDTIEFIVYPGIDTAANDLINGTIDLIGWTLKATDPTDTRYGNVTILGQSHLEVKNNPGLEYLYYGFNPIDELASKDLRVALAMLVNKDLYASVEPSTYVTHSPMTKFNGYWYNPDVTQYNAGYFYDNTGRQSSNYYPGLHELESLGYFDRDNNGWRESPDGSALAMTMLGPPLGEDLRKNTIATDLRVMLNNMDLSVSMETSGDPAMFDIYLDVAKSSLEPSALATIPMLAGYDFPALDAALTAADDALDMEMRQMYVHDAQQIISEEVPFVPLLFYDAIEASNRDRWDGMVDTVGGRFNFWSAVGIHKKEAGSLSLSVSTEDISIDSGGGTVVSVRVLDNTGGTVTGANVEFTADAGAFGTAAGTTDTLGVYETTYDGPAVTNVTDVHIMAVAHMPTYVGASGSATITVHPVVSSLVVTVGSGLSVIDSGGSTSITVVVADELNVPIAGATVYMTLGHAGASLGTVTPVAGQDGQFTASFTGNVTVDTLFKISVTAVKDGYETGVGFTDVVVKSWGGVQPEEITKTESIPDVGILAVISLTLVALLVVAYRRREH